MGCSNSKTRKGKAKIPPPTQDDRFRTEERGAPAQSSQLPIESVSERKTREAREQKELPVIYVDKDTKNFSVPKGGARVVVRGEEGERIQMQRQPPPQQQQQVRYVDANGNPVQVVNGQQVVYVQRPGYLYDPYPYYGYPYRYGYGCYPYGYGYGGFGTGLLLGAMLW